MTLRIGDPVRMVDRYGERRKCTCPAYEPSWFDGMRGKVTKTTPLMVHLEGERLPMRFDERDIVRADELPTEPNMSGAE